MQGERRRFRPNPAMVVALLALFVAMAGTGYAALKLPKNSVGSKQIKKDAVNSSKVKNHSLKAGDFKAGQLPAGPRGPIGPTGPAGTNGTNGTNGSDGAPATRLWAAIQPGSPPSVIRSGSAATVTRAGAGQYDIDFGSDIQGCAASATVAETATRFATAQLKPEFPSITRQQVHVVTWTPGAAPEDDKFYVEVFC
jgi:hypothetical protein